jgi:hypothetical protein
LTAAVCQTLLFAFSFSSFFLTRFAKMTSAVMEIKSDDMPLFISSLQQHLARF